MGIFFDPIDGPPSNRQQLGMVLYAILAVISIWATGESLSKTFDFPIFVSYLVGAAIVLIMAAMLTIIMKAIESRSIVPLVVGVFCFVLVWGISLTTNTHNFFLKGSLKDIQQTELKGIKKELEGLQVNSYAIVDDVVNKYRQNIAGSIKNYQNEVVNANNPGHGNVADSLKRIVEASMPGRQFPVPSKTLLNTSRQRRLFADKMGIEMTEELNNRISSMLTKKDVIKQLVNTQEFTDRLSDVNNTLSVFYNSDINENRRVISNAYSLYNGLKDKVNKTLISGQLRISDKSDDNIIQTALEETPGSIKLEHISNTYSYVKEKGGFSTSEFLFAFFLALGVDLGAFAIFYFMVLKKD